MRRFISGFTGLVLLIVLSTKATAGDAEDCKLSVPDLRIAACSRIIEKGGERKALAQTYALRGIGYNAKGEKDLAVADFEEAIRRDPSRATYVRGLIYSAMGDREKAIAEWDEAIRINPNDASTYNARGNAYSAKGELDRAIADYDKAIELDPKYAVAFSNRGNGHNAKGEYDQAIAVLNKAIELAPNYAAAYNNRGNSYKAKNELDRSIADYDKAIELDPKYALAYNNRGNAYYAKGDRDRAFAEYNKAIELDPKYALAYNNRGSVYDAKSDHDRAIDEYNKAIELDPKYALAYTNRGLAYEKKGDRDSAVADYRKVLELPAPTTADQQRKEIVRQRIARLTQTQAQPRKAAIPTARKRVALVIGNSKYVNAGQLPNPTNDARAVADSFRRLGFGEVIERYDLTHEAMGQIIKNFGDRAELAEWAVVFFAGHGLEMSGVNYLIPTDAKLERDTHVPDETISLTAVQSKVDAASKLGLVILDSCRNNPFLARMARSAGTTRSVGRGLANVEPEGNVLVIYSAKHGTTAEDGSGDHSPFAEALLKHIEEPGLEVNFLFRKVRDDVRTKTNRRQEPFLYGSLSSELLYFKEASAR